MEMETRKNKYERFKEDIKNKNWSELYTKVNKLLYINKDDRSYVKNFRNVIREHYRIKINDYDVCWAWNEIVKEKRRQRRNKSRKKRTKTIKMQSKGKKISKNKVGQFEEFLKYAAGGPALSKSHPVMRCLLIRMIDKILHSKLPSLQECLYEFI